MNADHDEFEDRLAAAVAGRSREARIGPGSAVDVRRRARRRARLRVAAVTSIVVAVGASAVLGVAARSGTTSTISEGSDPGTAASCFVTTTTTTPDPTTTSIPADPITTSITPTTLAPPTDDIAVTTVVRAEPVRMLAIGESVMAGAATALTGAGVVVDAAESRGPNGVLDVVWTHLAERDVQALVIQVGTNGTVSPEQYSAIAAAARDVPRVFFMTVKAPKEWIAGNNASIRALPAMFPNVAIIDWDATGTSIEDELSESDGGIHLDSADAIRVYANLILAADDLPLVD